MLMDYQIRVLTATDESIVWEMLTYAAQQPSIASTRELPFLARYAANWGRTGDLGYVATLNDAALGAAWLRLWVEEDKGFGYISDDIPELGLAVSPDYRGGGIGTQLLTQALEMARGKFSAVSLSVRSDNPVIRLYTRSGFVKVAGSEHPNRVETTSFTMLCKFDRD
jgi:ribosomal protein S18 acetylase RimI-like enzyme